MLVDIGRSDSSMSIFTVRLWLIELCFLSAMLYASADVLYSAYSDSQQTPAKELVTSALLVPSLFPLTNFASANWRM